MLIECVIKTLSQKKARSIALLDLRNVEDAVADYLIICTATSEKHTAALKDFVIEYAKKSCKTTPTRVEEGVQKKEWILLDYVDVILHIFVESKRAYYDLESMWGDAKITHFQDEITPTLLSVER